MSEEEKQPEEKRGLGEVVVQSILYLAIFIAFIIFLLYVNSEANISSNKAGVRPSQTTQQVELEKMQGVDS